MQKIILIIALSFLLGISSCSLFKKDTTKTAKEVEKVEIPIDGESVPDDDKEPATANIADTNYREYRHFSGEWTIVSVNGKKIDQEEMPFIIFEKRDKRIYGNNGCNVINGNFTLSENKSIRFDNVITTMKACPDAKYEIAINKALNEARTYSYSKIDGIVHINIYDQRGTKILKLRKHNLNALNGAWTVSEIANDHIDKNNVALVIDIDQLKLHGNSGCNIINGTIVLDANKKNAIQFQNLISTRMMCPEMNLETRLLVNLETVEYFKLENSNELHLYDNKMNRIIILNKIDLKE